MFNIYYFLLLCFDQMELLEINSDVMSDSDILCEMIVHSYSKLFASRLTLVYFLKMNKYSLEQMNFCNDVLIFMENDRSSHCWMLILDINFQRESIHEITIRQSIYFVICIEYRNRAHSNFSSRNFYVHALSHVIIYINSIDHCSSVFSEIINILSSIFTRWIFDDSLTDRTGLNAIWRIN